MASQVSAASKVAFMRSSGVVPCQNELSISAAAAKPRTTPPFQPGLVAVKTGITSGADSVIKTPYRDCPKHLVTDLLWQERVGQVQF
jgi:hypothetical protein